MSIQSEIQRIEDNVAAAFSAAADKGGTLPEELNSGGLPEAVRSIPSGGGNPLGTVISFMGLTAPAGYLVCDGAEHRIADYPRLAAFFAEQFGTANHFGGDGESTFAVPDLRNLFLRGYHGDGEEAPWISGDIGAKQNGSRLLNISSASSNSLYIRANNAYREQNELDEYIATDSAGEDGFKSQVEIRKSYTDPSSAPGFPFVVPRPMNMAVLYCIKAI